MRLSHTASEPILELNGEPLLADPSGALFWPAEATLILADLHLEKGSSFAPGGSLLPPYDTRATLARIAALVRGYQPRRVICLGDTFHDGAAGARLHTADSDVLRRLVARHEWIWIAGNHDPMPSDTFGGHVYERIEHGKLVFTHEARRGAAAGEISGHFHPTASLRLRAGRMTARCFVGDAQRIILPAFGAFTGGLDVFDPAIRRLFPDGFQVYALGREKVVSIASDRVAPSCYQGLSRHTL